jgi:hypothetical protein
MQSFFPLTRLQQKHVLLDKNYRRAQKQEKNVLIPIRRKKHSIPYKYSLKKSFLAWHYTCIYKYRYE